jgi:hypothetical protein
LPSFSIAKWRLLVFYRCMRTLILFAILLLSSGVLWAGPAEEQAARKAAIAKELDTINAQLQAHGGSFEKWAEELQPYREDLQFVGKVPSKGNLNFSGASVAFLKDDALALSGFDVILDLHRQLKARGTDLILTIIPSKLCVYPDYVQVAPGQPARCPADRQVALGAKKLYAKLLENDVEVIDLYTAYQEARDKTQDKVRYVYQTDSHWNNAGCRLAADRIGERLQRYDFVKAALAKGNPFTFKPGSRADGNKADPDMHFVQRTDGSEYKDVDDAPVVLTGDSFSVYNVHLKAHLSAQVALRTGVPVTLMGHEGLSFDLPVKLAQEPTYATNRRVLVWTFNDKMLAKARWVKAELPATTAAPAVVAEVKTVTATITEVSAPPLKNAPYPNYYLLAYAKDQDAVLHILAMYQRKILPAATLRPGDKIEVTLTPWSKVAKTHGRIQSGRLPTVELQIKKPHYLAEIPGAPVLTDADLQRAGEE